MNTFDDDSLGAVGAGAVDGDHWLDAEDSDHEHEPAEEDEPIHATAAAPTNKKKEEEDEKVCRICFGNEEDGKLISPCLCKGSMKYIHKTCLETWRKASTNKESFFKCDQCKFKYKFLRSDLAAWITHPIVVSLLSVLVFGVSVLLMGFFAKLIDVVFGLELGINSTSFFRIDMAHILSGVMGMGFTGFFSIAIGGMLRPFIHSLGFTSRNEDNKCDQIILVIIVVVGTVKAFMVIYNLCSDYTKKFLTHAEDMVENIHS